MVDLSNQAEDVNQSPYVIKDVYIDGTFNINLSNCLEQRLQIDFDT